MTTVAQKTAALIAAYGNQDALNYILKVIGNKVAHEIISEPRPVPPLKQVTEYGKIQLILDKQDENYLLLLSKHKKREAIAQRTVSNDTVLQDVAYRLLVSNFDVHLANSESDLESYLQSITDDLAQCTAAERNAVIPIDETL